MMMAGQIVDREVTTGLLVGVLNEALILWCKGRHDGVVSLVHGGLDVLQALTDGIDRLVNG